MDRGRPGFRQGSTCPAVLRYRIMEFHTFRVRGSHALRQAFPDLSAAYGSFCLHGSSPCGPTTPLNAVWAVPRSLAATYGISGGSLLFLISFPELLRWFTSLSLAPAAYFIQLFRCMLMHAGYPIRQSGDQRMFAPSPGLSQLTTAFIAFRLPGIHHKPVFA